MRTTVTLDPDVEVLINELMETRGISFKQALNDAVRAGAPARADYFFETPGHDLGKALDIDEYKTLVTQMDREYDMKKMLGGSAALAGAHETR